MTVHCPRMKWSWFLARVTRDPNACCHYEISNFTPLFVHNKFILLSETIEIMYNKYWKLF